MTYEHKDVPANKGANHVPYDWTYANAAARTGASGFVSADIGKLARQTDDNTLWMLTATTPTWQAVGGNALAALTLSANKIIYIDNSGDPQLLSLGASGMVLTSAGETSAPTFSAPSGLPVGTVIAHASETVPSGFLECNGAAVSRTTYASLFAAIGIIHGQGDGSTTFNLPDLRGRFLRGWDHGAGRDPDRASRTAAATGGQTGDHVGSIQNHMFYNHNHDYYTGNNSGSNNHIVVNNVYSTTMSFSTSSTGGNETRPININLMFCIKY